MCVVLILFPPNQTASETLSCGKLKNVVSKGPPVVTFLECILSILLVLSGFAN